MSLSLWSQLSFAPSPEQLSALVLEPLPTLHVSAWLCLLCDFGVVLSCMLLCTGSIPGARASLDVCRAVGGQGSSTPAPSDPWLAFAGGQCEENHGPRCDEKIAAA